MRLLALTIAILIALPIVYVASKSSTTFGTKSAEVGSDAMGSTKTISALEVSARTDKAVYNRGETIRLEILLKNLSEEPISLYGSLSWGHSASLTLRVTDAAGKEIPAKYLDDSLTPPPPPNDQSFFVNLNPHHFFGTVRESSLDELNINKPGKYKIVVEYHSPIPQSFGKGLSLWGREKGSIRSKPTQVEVVSSK